MNELCIKSPDKLFSERITVQSSTDSNKVSDTVKNNSKIIGFALEKTNLGRLKKKL